MPKKLTQDEWIAKAREIHNGYYDYSLTKFKSTRDIVTVICPLHGEFSIIAKNHSGTQKQGCRACGYIKNAKNRSLSQEQFIQRSKEHHGDTYDYSKVVYTKSEDKVIIICQVHGEFQQIASHHMNGCGCQKCHIDLHRPNKLLSTEQWILKALNIHGERFDYSETIYTGANNYVTIICPTHGEFRQIANDHTSKKAGCPSCAGVKRFTTEDFIAKARTIHGDKYEYGKVDYVRSSEKVVITCRTHGDFIQTANDHLSCKAGCPSCGCNGVSQAENDIADFLRSLNIVVEVRNRSIIKPLELDIVLPEFKIAIEFNGLYYHSDAFDGRTNKHKIKTDMVNSVGHRLIHIYEDDWRDKQEIVKKTLKHILGFSEHRLFARKLEVVRGEAKGFFEDNHIQGNGFGLSYCLKDDGNIVAAMQFSKAYSERGNVNSNRYELVRFASSCAVIGGASKLFSAFLKDNPDVKTIISYSDNSMFTGEMYEKLGFEKVGEVKPDYKVICNGKRMHKANFKKSRLKKNNPEVYSDDLTEKEICHKLKLYRIYNSGLTKWQYNIDN